MNIVDLNILIYGVNRNAHHHQTAKAWLEEQLNGNELIGIPWLVILGFLRIMTNGKIFPAPLSEDEAVEVADSWLSHPLVRIPSPKPAHWKLVKELISESGTAGNLTSDIHIAALTILHGATLFTLDNDFGRFKGLRWKRPF